MSRTFLMLRCQIHVGVGFSSWVVEQNSIMDVISLFFGIIIRIYQLVFDPSHFPAQQDELEVI